MFKSMMNLTGVGALAGVIASVFLGVSPGLGQCGLRWTPVPELPGVPVNGFPIRGQITGVWDTCEWDADGPGPIPNKLVIGGTVFFNGRYRGFVAAWDGVSSELELLGPYMDTASGATASSSLPIVSGVCSDGPNLYMGGAVNINGTISRGVARWSGNGSGPSGGWIVPTNQLVGLSTVTDVLINDMVAFNGEIYACGEFLRASGQPVTMGVIKYVPGTNVHAAAGDGLYRGGPLLTFPGGVTALAVFNGQLIAGGGFNLAGGTYNGQEAGLTGNFRTVRRLAVLNTATNSWSEYAGGISETVPPFSVISTVYDLAAFGNRLIVAGSFVGSNALTNTNSNNILGVNGSGVWSTLGAGFPNADAFRRGGIVIAGGDLFAMGGSLSFGTTPALFVARYNSTLNLWLSDGPQLFGRSMGTFNGQLVVNSFDGGGGFGLSLSPGNTGYVGVRRTGGSTPTIVQDLQDGTACTLGSAFATFSLQYAAGFAWENSQVAWSVNGESVPVGGSITLSNGATASSSFDGRQLFFSGLTSLNDGNLISANIVTPCGTNLSTRAARLSVTSANPTITTQPPAEVSYQYCQSEPSGAGSVVVSVGAGPQTNIRWRDLNTGLELVDGTTSIAGVTVVGSSTPQLSLLINSEVGAENLDFRILAAVARNGCNDNGNVISDAVTLERSFAEPVFSQMPANVLGFDQSPVTLTARSNTAPVRYQWERFRPEFADYVPVTGTLVSTDGTLAYTISSFSSSFEGTYRAVLIYGCASELIASNTATITASSVQYLNPLPDIGVCLGDSLVVSAELNVGATYRWRLNGVALTDGLQADSAMISGAGTSDLMIDGLNLAYAGELQCVATTVTGGLVVPSRIARLSFESADVGVQGGGFGSDGSLDNNDFASFLNLFFGGSVNADLGGQGGTTGADGVFDNNDFVTFIALFFNSPCG